MTLRKRGDEVDLREHLESMIKERDRRYDAQFVASERAVEAALAAAKEAVSAALTAAKEAVVKAEMATEKRLENTNEWRQTLNDVTAKCVKWPEAIALVTVVSLVISTVIGVVAFFLTHIK